MSTKRRPITARPRNPTSPEENQKKFEYINLLLTFITSMSTPSHQPPNPAHSTPHPQASKVQQNQAPRLPYFQQSSCSHNPTPHISGKQRTTVITYTHTPYLHLHIHSHRNRNCNPHSSKSTPIRSGPPRIHPTRTQNVAFLVGTWERSRGAGTWHGSLK